ncbi:hypothetical protein [Marinifilum caeruleilacunae]|uniref:Uncharacterized protein n=1 Tax=Marinifilum caeruleilacunae TaxID=2499076 RepID=A0ABX1X2Q1_9BACT|nr:hypothetical protein [Marinifilum caeruleilacunae]NOU62363.1 hypothetical protein [Marinifilum caeruleilacunae]
MNKKDLKEELDLLNVNQEFYSLNGDLIPDTIVLVENYDLWEVFYFDERGSINNKKDFKTEKEACLYIYNLFVKSKEIKDRFKGNNL